MQPPLSRLSLAILLAGMPALVFWLAHSGFARAQPTACAANPSPPPNTMLVTSPVPGQRVTSPVRVSGEAAAFEAQIRLTLYAANGDILADVSGRTMEGQRLSPFSVSVPFFVAQDTPACLWVYSNSARDGSPINVVQVPLILTSTSGSAAVWLNRPPTAPTALSMCPQSGQWLLLYWGGPIAPIDVAAQACLEIDRIWVSRDGRWQGFSAGQRTASDSWTPLPGEAHFLHRR